MVLQEVLDLTPLLHRATQEKWLSHGSSLAPGMPRVALATERGLRYARRWAGREQERAYDPSLERIHQHLGEQMLEDGLGGSRTGPTTCLQTELINTWEISA